MNATTEAYANFGQQAAALLDLIAAGKLNAADLLAQLRDAAELSDVPGYKVEA